MRMLHEARTFVEAFGERHGLAEGDVLRLQLVIEELFTNTVNHGYGREGDDPVVITLGTTPGGVRLLYEDAAPAYDPLATLRAPAPGVALPLEERPVGRVGIQLVAGMAKEAQYSRAGDRNRLTVLVETRP
jgi:anti-sigma regulatory factor (Ser/Thr protein kinase)